MPATNTSFLLFIDAAFLPDDCLVHPTSCHAMFSLHWVILWALWYMSTKQTTCSRWLVKPKHCFNIASSQGSYNQSGLLYRRRSKDSRGTSLLKKEMKPCTVQTAGLQVHVCQTACLLHVANSVCLFWAAQQPLWLTLQYMSMQKQGLQQVSVHVPAVRQAEQWPAKHWIPQSCHKYVQARLYGT